ncbi:HipA N-terminal domain-containing protein [Fibrobacter sp.]|uniref:HipA N-terminal domain-containing protein n=1 Tax=Fibrobacter sp. TaxID=35828 RepID=UPI00386A0D6C
MPLSADEFSQKECLPFFEGLLPEGDVKRRISDYLHISESSTLKLLQELGGECAGLVSILPESEENKMKNVYDFSSLNYEPLSEKKTCRIHCECQHSSFVESESITKSRKSIRTILGCLQKKLG